MAELVFHEQTERQLATMIVRPAHAILLSGSPGVGKMAAAHYLATRLLAIDVDKLSRYPYAKLVEVSDSKSISIDAVRDLNRFFTLKVDSDKAVNRVAIISDAHLLTNEAQNALLKTLEEPPAKTVLILTSSYDEALLPTIRSRTQSITIQKPSLEQLRRHFTAQGFASDAVKQALAMSAGLPGLTNALLQEDRDHPLVRSVQTARLLLQQTTYERLQSADELSKQKPLLDGVLFMLEQMASAALLHTATSGVKRWQQVLSAAYQAREQLQHNGQPKLVLTNLLLQL